MILLEGPEFVKAEPSVVAEYLSATPRDCLNIVPANLSVKNDGQNLMLQVVNGKVKEYPIRKSFLYKLLKWYSFPIHQLSKMSIDTVTSLCNDYLVNIKSDNVKVKTENGEALTIISDKYNDFPDLDVIEMCGGLGIKEISRNDFLMRIYTHEKFKTEPIPKDPCGFSLNIINSDTGFGALSISHYILRYICSNGAVARVDASDERKIHFGYKEGELQAFLNEQIMHAFESRMKLANFIRASVEQKACDYVKQISLKIDRLPGRSAGREFLSELEQNATKYDLFNLITHKAKDYGIGERLYLERIAGELIGE